MDITPSSRTVYLRQCGMFFPILSCVREELQPLVSAMLRHEDLINNCSLNGTCTNQRIHDKAANIVEDRVRSSNRASVKVTKRTGFQTQPIADHAR